MLSLHNVTINLQNFGTILGVFLTSKNVTAIEQRYYSFFNRGATGGDLEWWSDTCALFWIHSSGKIPAEEKFKNALTQGCLSEIMARRHTRGYNPWPDACAMAADRYARIEWVNWFVAGVQNLDIFGIAHAIVAERGTGNFNDDVLAPALDFGKSTLGVIHAKYIEDPDTLGERHHEQDDSDSEDIQLGVPGKAGAGRPKATGARAPRQGTLHGGNGPERTPLREAGLDASAEARIDSLTPA